MFRSNGPARVLGALALAAAVATASTASNEASSSKAFPQDPRVEQRAAAVKRAPAGTAVPSERYLAAAANGRGRKLGLLAYFLADGYQNIVRRFID